jgi:hypothetical protein
MKIALATLGIAVAAVLVVSATMAAGLIDAGSNGKDENLAAPPSGKARILPLSMNPLRIKGTGFVPRETVRVTEVSGSAKVTRTVKAGPRGGFVVTLPPRATVDRCNGLLVVAKGDKGSKTSFQLSSFMCPMARGSG